MKIRCALVYLVCVACLCCCNTKRYEITSVTCGTSGIYDESYAIFLLPFEAATKREYYLTDSVNFRVYVGTVDFPKIMQFTCKGDSIFAEDFIDLFVESTFSRSFSIKELKKSKVFDKP
jgi:hypothetical protein